MHQILQSGMHLMIIIYHITDYSAVLTTDAQIGIIIYIVGPCTFLHAYALSCSIKKPIACVWESFDFMMPFSALDTDPMTIRIVSKGIFLFS